MKNIAAKLLTGLALVALTLVAVPVTQAADKAPPLSVTIEKTASTDKAPYVLKLKNDAQESVKVSAKVLMSVVAHNMDKSRMIPEQTVAAGKTMVIEELAAMDKVTVMTEGYAPLEVEIR